MSSDFDKYYNISYIEQDVPPSNKLIIKHCLASYAVYLLVFVLLLLNPFFKKYFSLQMQHFYMTCYFIYVFIAPVLYFIFRPKTLYKSHNVEICNYIVRIFKQIFNKNTLLKADYLNVMKSFVPSYNEKQALMLIFIKMFFGILMVSSLLSNIAGIKSYLNGVSLAFHNGNFSDFNVFKNYVINNGNYLYGFLLMIIFTIDLIPFVTGYLTEVAFLNNKIRTVDTNIAGIIFCLVCYPPFNSAVTRFIGWNQNNNIANNDFLVLNWIFHITGLLFLAIYAWASVTLGFKASNLTNRGIVTKFPYNIVRHPAYICKNMFWFFTTIQVLFVNFKIPGFNLGSYLINSCLVILSWSFWALIYYFRAITEERHLMQDPDYQEYVKKVRWRFIPHVI